MFFERRDGSHGYHEYKARFSMPDQIWRDAI